MPRTAAASRTAASPSDQVAPPPSRPAPAPEPAPAPGATAPPRRMSIASIHRGPRPAPDRILLYGVEGVGKSTFAAEAPAPVFLAAEDGVRHLDVAVFPEPRTWPEAREAVASLLAEGHEYQTLVVDTLDWLEPLVHAEVCRRNRWSDIEAPGYGKGYVPATEELRSFLLDLDRLRAARGMQIILLGHAAIKPFANPAGTDYSRYELKLQKSAAALVKEWCDAILFAQHEEYAQEVKGGRPKGVSTGKRVVHTERRAAWDAKNRHNLPEVLPLSYLDYAEARAAGRPADPDALLAEAEDLLGRVAEDVAQKARAHLAQVKSDAAALARAVTRLRALAAEPAASPAT